MIQRWLRFGAAGCCVLLLAACGDPAPEPPREPISALLITVDTLRADRLHCYGFPEENSPNIDALAARGVLFENGIAASSVTAPSHASIMTSRFVRGHSIGSNNGGSRLEGATTLAGVFRDAGYQTAAFVGNWVLLPRIGLDQGFDTYDAELTQQELNRPHLTEREAKDTGARVLEWLSQPREGPFFLWVQLQDPHGPYTPPETWRGRFPASDPGRRLEPIPFNSGTGGVPAYQVLEGVDRAGDYDARYVEEIAYADEWIGRIVAAAERAAGGGGLAVVFTADHGESLGERGYFYQHGHTITPDLARVPFVAAAPSLPAARRSDTVHHVDVMPTLLELSGVAIPEGSTGVALGRLVRSGTAIPERTVFSDIGRELGVYRGDQFVRVVGSPDFWGDWAGGRGAAGSPPESLLAFESFAANGLLESVDPEPSLRADIEAYLKDEVEIVPAAHFTEADEERLRALGYLESEEEGGGEGP